MSWIVWGTLGLTAVAALGFLALATRPSPDRTIWSNTLYALGRLYARGLHDVSVTGEGNIPAARDAGPMIVVANHTAGVDPILVSAVCPFHIRWIMAEDMRLPWLDWFWRWQRVIFVTRSGKDRAPVREALNHLKRGGVIGIFPEGGLERPPRRLLPFQKGVGFMIAKAGVPVLPFFIDNTPQVDPAWSSLWRPSQSTLDVAPAIDYAKTDLGPAAIADDLRARYLAWTGWERNDTPPPVGEDDPKAVPHATHA